MLRYNYVSTLTDAQIEERARGLGMHTKDDCKVIFEGDDRK